MTTDSDDVPQLDGYKTADNPLTGGEANLRAIIEQSTKRFPELTFDFDGECLLPISAENLQIVFDNLFDNAAKLGAAHLVITASATEQGKPVRVQDGGAGISAGNAEQIFALFFTTRRETGGTGLGLGIVSSLLKAHKGTIALVPSKSGACFEIEFSKITV